jgi:hypothetical protein
MAVRRASWGSAPDGWGCDQPGLDGASTPAASRSDLDTGGVRDQRRAPRHTALGGLLNGTLRFTWRSLTQTVDPDGMMPIVWDGSGADPE